MPATDLAIPFFGYKSHISIDRKFQLIRKWKTTDAAASDGARLREGLPDKSNTASTVWADTAYRSKVNENFMEEQGFVSKVHRKKPHLFLSLKTGKTVSTELQKVKLSRIKVRL